MVVVVGEAVVVVDVTVVLVDGGGAALDVVERATVLAGALEGVAAVVSGVGAAVHAVRRKARARLVEVGDTSVLDAHGTDLMLGPGS